MKGEGAYKDLTIFKNQFSVLVLKYEIECQAYYLLDRNYFTDLQAFALTFREYSFLKSNRALLQLLIFSLSHILLQHLIVFSI